MKTLRYYQIGFAVLSLFAVSIAIVLAVQAGAFKEDVQTYKTAEKAAEKLENYIYDKNEIPKSLKAAGVSEDNPNISYKKLSNEKYEFCVTYRAKSEGADISSVIADAMYGSFEDVYEEGSYEPSSLYLSSAHDRGKDCQTIKPYIDNTYHQDTQSLQQFDGEQSMASDYYADQMQAQIGYGRFTDEGIKTLNEVTKICASTYANHESEDYHGCMKSAYNAYH